MEHTNEGKPGFEKFCRESLAVYACGWVERCQNVIAAHAREIYEDATLREMVCRYAELDAKKDKAERYAFSVACVGEDDTVVGGGSTYEKSYAMAYKQVLDDLIFERWCRKVG